MIRGIGVDLVNTQEIARYLQTESLSGSFINHTFTEQERLSAPEGLHQRAEYFAARFAAKEAVFKAVAHLTVRKTFDLSLVETLHHKDGSPFVHITPALRSVLDEAGVMTTHISITTEGAYAAAFVVAEGWT